MSMNVALLRKAVDWAEEQAQLPYEQCAWDQDHFVIPGVVLGRECGTCYCVAGYIVHTVDGQVVDRFENSSMRSTVIVRAAELLGVEYYDVWSGEDSGALFDGSNSIEEVRLYAAELAERYGEEL